MVDSALHLDDCQIVVAIIAFCRYVYGIFIFSLVLFFDSQKHFLVMH